MHFRFTGLILMLLGCQIPQAPIVLELKVPASVLPTPFFIPQAAPSIQTLNTVDIRISPASPSPALAVLPSASPTAGLSAPVVTTSSPTTQPPMLDEHSPMVKASVSSQLQVVPAATPSPLLPMTTAIPTPTLTDLVLTPPSTAHLISGSTLPLNAALQWSDGTTSQDFTWNSSDLTVATVNNQGLVTAIRPGVVQIQATALANQNIRKSVSLTVQNPVVEFPGKIIYLSKQDLYLMEGRNVPVRITTNGGTQEKKFPRLSWDGQKVIYASIDRNIYTISLTSPFVATDAQMTPNWVEPLPLFWHDGSILLQGFGEPKFYSGAYHIWRQLPDLTMSTYTHQLGFVSFLAGVTPDGLMVYEKNGEIRRSNYQEPTNALTYGPGYDPKLPLNSNPNRVVYTFNNKIKSALLNGQNNQFLPTPADAANPALSPDETKIAFVSQQSGNRDIYLMNLDGTGLVNLTNTPDVDECQPDWSR